jgi:integrase
MARITDRLVAKAAATARQPGMYADGNGLYLRVAPGGSKSWILRYRHGGRRHDIGLGPYPLIGLADARQRANQRRRLLVDGIDPLADRRAQRAAAAVERMKAITLRQAAESYIDAHAAGWRGGKQEAQWRQSLTAFAYPTIGELPVQAIDVGLVMKVLEPIWTAKPETASRVRGRIESVLDWATARGYRFGENPARWRGHLDNLLPARAKVQRVEHHPALPYAEIGAFMAWLRPDTNIAARALEFLILTAARSGEVLQARWDEINLPSRLWTVPAERMKSGREHRVPLSDAAIAIVKAMAAIQLNDYVFPGRRGALGRTALFDQLRRIGRADLTTHGFRATFRSWSAERTNFPREVAELALAHSVGTAVERAYQRSDLFAKRRQLADAWAKFCATPAVTGEVVPLRPMASPV